MTPTKSPTPTRWRCRVGLGMALLAGVAGSTAAPLSGAQDAAQAPRQTAPTSPVEQGVRWSGLKPAQQATLKPLEREWAAVSPAQKQKWLELSTRFPQLTPTEQSRIQQRMAEWARLTPQERGQARLNFQEAKQMPAQDRQARWNAYQTLSPEEKQQLAARAAPAAVGDAVPKAGDATSRTDKPSRERSQAKSNIVPNPALASSPKAIAPTVVQARPGATTTLITKRPIPPSHQQTGLPKIAATPGFVDRATLLPQRGPQAAATRSTAATATTADPSPRQ